MISSQTLRQSVPYTVNTLVTCLVTLRKSILNIWGAEHNTNRSFPQKHDSKTCRLCSTSRRRLLEIGNFRRPPQQFAFSDHVSRNGDVRRSTSVSGHLISAEIRTPMNALSEHCVLSRPISPAGRTLRLSSRCNYV
jgi:hypothetical protein